jgi:hypothetical protein
MSDTSREVIETTAAAGAGGVTGGIIIAISGMSAAGMVGGGAGIGAAAGPVGVVAGAVTGVAVLTVARTANKVQQDPKVRKFAKSTNEKTRKFVKLSRQKVGHWISGDDNNGETTEGAMA